MLYRQNTMHLIRKAESAKRTPLLHRAPSWRSHASRKKALLRRAVWFWPPASRRKMERHHFAINGKVTGDQSGRAAARLSPDCFIQPETPRDRAFGTK